MTNTDEPGIPLPAADKLALDISLGLEKFFRGVNCETLNAEHAEFLIKCNFRPLVQIYLTSKAVELWLLRLD